MRKTRKNRTGAFPSKDIIALKIAVVIVRAQQRLAGVLHRYEQRLTAKQKKIALAAFCLVCAAWCGYLLVHALLAPLPHKPAVNLNPAKPINPISDPLKN